MWTKRINRMAGGLCLGTVLACAGPAAAQESLSDYSLYGIDGSDLISYRFADGQASHVGPIVAGFGGTLLSGIEGTAYIPGHANIYGFWRDPASGQTRLVYINATTASAAIVGQPMGGAKVTGAVAVSGNQGTEVFAVRVGVACSGTVNINPNNRTDYEFTLTKPDGSTITRDDLHKDAAISAAGLYYSGPAAEFRVKPKGDGAQNTVAYDSNTYTLRNPNRYRVAGSTLQVTIFNDKVTNGKAMGQWQISFQSPAATVEEFDGSTEQAVGGLGGDLVLVNHRTGAVTRLMMLTGVYDSLAVKPDGSFLAASGNKLVQIDPLARTEALVGVLAGGSQGLENLGTSLYGSGAAVGTLITLDTNSGAVLSTISVGSAKFSSIVFLRNADLEDSLNYD